MANTEARPALRVLITACIGSALEWYDFFLFGTASALVFGPLFFPKSEPIVGTLLSFLTFGVGFAVRPLGGIVFGALGDRWGRKPILVFTLLTIGLGTMTIGLLPTYQSIGIWAPVLLVALRVLQGLGAGAEYGGAVILLVEYAPAHRRGLWGGFAPLGVALGNLLAAGAFGLVTMLPEHTLMDWGWRLPFLASALLVVVGLYVRLRVVETPVFRDAVERRHKVERNSAWSAFRKNPRNFFVVMGACMENALGYLFPVFGLNYLIVTLGVPRSTALSALMLAFALETCAVLFYASLTDRIGRRPVYMFGGIAGILLAFPFFWMVGTRKWIWIAAAFILARVVVQASMLGAQAAFFAELFPPQRRFAGFAAAREIGNMLAGGPVPFVATALLTIAKGAWWPVAAYAAVMAGITVFAVWCGPETYNADIASTGEDATLMSSQGSIAAHAKLSA
jgi:MFS family permease